jgi:NAD+ kinase
MFRKVGLILKDDSQQAQKVAKKIEDYLEERGVRCFYENMKEMDLVISLGGDGTLLKAADFLKGREIPLLGVNIGTVGFLTEVTSDNWMEYLDRVLKGEYRIMERAKLSVRVDGKDVGEALNEAVVMTSTPVRMLWYRITVEGQIAQEVRADGVIVSTPTGSTAYSMSVGGPIVAPSVRAFVVSFISPFKLTSRPLVIHDTAEIRVKVLDRRRGATVVLDGQRHSSLPEGGEVVIRRSDNQVHIMKFEKGGFFRKLRERLGA